MTNLGFHLSPQEPITQWQISVAISESTFASTVPSALEQLTGIPESEAFPVSERLTAFFFLLLDQLEALEADRSMLSEAFDNEAASFTSEFHGALRNALSEVMRSPDVSLVNRMLVDTAPSRLMVAEMFVQLFQTSLRDTSEGNERSAALSDKLIAASASLLSSPIPQKTVDVFRYAVEAEYIPLSKIPIISGLFELNSDPSETEDSSSIHPEPDSGEDSGTK